MGTKYYRGISKSSYDSSIKHPPQGTMSNISIEDFSESKESINPDPTKFQIEDFEEINRFLIVKVKYPNCVNFEGKKILVYKDTKIDQLLKQGTIDPHFSASRLYYSPTCRFFPTREGAQMAKSFCKNWKWN